MNPTLNILENKPLDQLNTLGLRVNARYFAEVNTVDELREALKYARQQGLPVVPLGEGSNVVLGEDLNALVLLIRLKERTLVCQQDGLVIVRGGAGECWHKFVLWSLKNNAFGLENLSLIPGTLGAAPIQNIGAYGVELKDRFVSLEAVSVETGEVVTFSLAECAFGYRDSIFKGAWRDQYIITSVTLKLDAELKPKLDYGHLRGLLHERLSGQHPSGMDISQAVCDIRRQKLPDPKHLGNAGSFFKNPVVSQSTFSKLQARHPDIVGYSTGDQWKLAAGWLIDKAGLKGFRQGGVGTYEHQALVLINYGQATSHDVLLFSQFVQSKVKAMFGVELEPEPRFY